MSRTLNFYNKEIISKEELIQWDASQRELVGNLIALKGNKKGILDNWTGSALENGFFAVTVPNSSLAQVNIAAGYGVLDVSGSIASALVSGMTVNNGSLVKQKSVLFQEDALTSVDVTNGGAISSPATIYVGFVPQFNPLEKGTCQITASSNTVAITGGDYTMLRDQTYKNPSKVRFYETDGSTPTNSQIYEVISISGSSMVISGSLTNESNLKLMVVGSYDLSIQGGLTDHCSYVKYEGKLTFTTTSTDITSNGGFLIASLAYNSGSTPKVVVTDLRQGNLMDFTLPSNISYIDGNETITGLKIFNNKPAFNRFIQNTFNGDGSLTISSNTVAIANATLLGSVFTVKATSGYSTLQYITLDSGFQVGTVIYLKINSVSAGTIDVNIVLSDVSNGIKVNGQSSGTITVSKGSILELMVDSDFSWTILNPTQLGIDTGWITVASIYDGTDAIRAGNSTLVLYRIKNGVCYIHYVLIGYVSSGVVRFHLPPTCTSIYTKKYVVNTIANGLITISGVNVDFSSTTTTSSDYAYFQFNFVID